MQSTFYEMEIYFLTLEMILLTVGSTSFIRKYILSSRRSVLGLSSPFAMNVLD